MRKLIVSEFLTLDGVMEAPETWQMPYHSADAAEFTKDQILSLDAMLYGRVTYDIFAGFWPTQTENQFGFSDHLNNAPKLVVSKTLKSLSWNNASLVSGEPVAAIAALKGTPGGPIGVTGSATLVKALLKAGLVDELQVIVYPVVVGKGVRLFEPGTAPMTLKLVSSRTFESGAVSLIYQSNGN